MQEQTNSELFMWISIKIESHYSGGLSHVSSQPAVPLDTWNTSGQQKTFLEIYFLTLTHEIITKKFTIFLHQVVQDPPSTTGLRCWTRRELLLWRRSSRIHSSRRKSASRNGKPRKRTVFYEETWCDVSMSRCLQIYWPGKCWEITSSWK